MQCCAHVYTIRCLINDPPSPPQMEFSFGNSVYFITEYWCEQLHKFDMALKTCSLVSTIVQVNIDSRAWHIRDLSKDVSVNSELPELLRGHLKIEVGVLGCWRRRQDQPGRLDIPSGHSTRMMIFPNSGTTVCLGGLKHLLNMGLTMNSLIPSTKVIQAVGGSTLMCQGWFAVKFIVHGKTTKQALYI